MGMLKILKMAGGGGVLVDLFQILTGLVVDWYVGVNACFLRKKRWNALLSY